MPWTAAFQAQARAAAKLRQSLAQGVCFGHRTEAVQAAGHPSGELGFDSFGSDPPLDQIEQPEGELAVQSV